MPELLGGGIVSGLAVVGREQTSGSFLSMLAFER